MHPLVVPFGSQTWWPGAEVLHPYKDSTRVRDREEGEDERQKKISQTKWTCYKRLRVNIEESYACMREKMEEESYRSYMYETFLSSPSRIAFASSIHTSGITDTI